MTITGKDLKPGMVIRLENDPWLVQKAVLTKSGTNHSIVKTKLKNLLTGYKTEIVYSAEDEVDEAIYDQKEATLSFINGNTYTFMDVTDYTMYELDSGDIESVLPYIEEGMEDISQATFFDDRLVSVALPVTVSRKVIHVESGSGGGALKQARIVNGTEIKVPDSVKVDDMIDIDTRDGTFKGLSKR